MADTTTAAPQDVRLVTYLKQLARPQVAAPAPLGGGSDNSADTATSSSLQIASEYYEGLNSFAHVVGTRIAEAAVYVATSIRQRHTVNEECVFHALHLLFPGPFGIAIGDRARLAVETFQSEQSRQQKSQAKKADLTLPPPRFRRFFEDGTVGIDGRVLIGKLAPVTVAAAVEQITQDILMASVRKTRAQGARRVNVDVLRQVLREHPDFGPLAAQLARVLTVGAAAGAAGPTWWSSTI